LRGMQQLQGQEDNGEHAHNARSSVCSSPEHEQPLPTTLAGLAHVLRAVSKFATPSAETTDMFHALDSLSTTAPKGMLLHRGQSR
jgi:hypothetical protein